MSKLPYTTPREIANAHAAGVRFHVHVLGSDYEVTEIRATFAVIPGVTHLSVTWRDGAGVLRTSTGFRPDGTFAGRIGIRLRRELPPAPVLRPAEPFLNLYVLGEPAYCPKTREVVAAIRFVPGGIETELRNAEGVSRVSTNYDHRGKHKWVPERTLVIGEVPPQEASSSTPAKVFVYRETWNGHTRFPAHTRAIGTEGLLAGGTRRLLGILDIPA